MASGRGLKLYLPETSAVLSLPFLVATCIRLFIYNVDSSNVGALDANMIFFVISLVLNVLGLILGIVTMFKRGKRLFSTLGIVMNSICLLFVLILLFSMGD